MTGSLPAEHEEDEDIAWDIGVFDAHCHPTDTMGSVPAIQKMRTKTLTIMATRAQDQELVEQVALTTTQDAHDTSDSNISQKIIPAFGWHPWFSHQICIANSSSADATEEKEARKIKHYREVLTPAPENEEFIASLPDPIGLSDFIKATEQRLTANKHALIGEVGLDKAFRIPEAWLPSQRNDRDDSLTPGGREGRRLSPYRVQMAHQREILTAQLNLAGKMQRAVSIHGVQAHGMLYDTLEATWKGHERQVLSNSQKKRLVGAKDDPVNNESNNNTSDNGTSPKPYPPRICLHSYSGPPDPLKQYLSPSVPVDVYFSFSMVINFSTAAASKTEQVIKAVPADRILVESDMHIAGDEMDKNLINIVKKVCDLKGWSLQAGSTQLHKNWQQFVYG